MKQAVASRRVVMPPPLTRAGVDGHVLADLVAGRRSTSRVGSPAYFRSCGGAAEDGAGVDDVALAERACRPSRRRAPEHASRADARPGPRRRRTGRPRRPRPSSRRGSIDGGGVDRSCGSCRARLRRRAKLSRASATSAPVDGGAALHAPAARRRGAASRPRGGAGRRARRRGGTSPGRSRAGPGSLPVSSSFRSRRMPASCAIASTISTPGMIGWSG